MDNNGEIWDWHRKDYRSENSNVDTSPCMWNGIITNQDHSYMFDETTPIKACGDVTYQVADNVIMVKEPEERRETSLHAKRRRMLLFDVDQSLCRKELSSEFLKSKEIEYLVEEAVPEVSPWPFEFTDMPPFAYEKTDLSSNEWLSECLIDAEMTFSPDNMDFSEASDIQIDISEYCNIPPEHEVNMVQQNTPRKIVFRGRKSMIRTPTKVASSVAYPFTFVKPCGVHGDTTLNDINQRIRTPPPSKSKAEDPMVIYPTSAFSGKPVVGKTKIHTEGGKGSITIMRTKG